MYVALGWREGIYMCPLSMHPVKQFVLFWTISTPVCVCTPVARIFERGFFFGKGGGGY